MAIPKDTENKHERLTSLYASPPSTGLNEAFRKELELALASKTVSLTQDCIGNIYLTRPGTDSSLSAIALSFPLDSPSPKRFNGALHTFLELGQIQTKCDVILLGWSSPDGTTIGQDIWEEDFSIEEAYERYPALRAFKYKSEVSDFSLSAILEVIEDEKTEVVVRGSPLLADKARSTINVPVTVETGGPSSGKCPVVGIRGKEAVAVGRATVGAYSDYVAKLFENFD